MSTITNTIVLDDQMSEVLKSVAEHARYAIKIINDMKPAIESASRTIEMVNRHAGGLSQTFETIERAFGDVPSSIDEAARSSRHAEHEANRWAGSMKAVHGAVKAIAGNKGIQAAIGQMRQGLALVDQETRARIRMQSVIAGIAQSQGEAIQMNERMVELARELEKETSLGANAWKDSLTTLLQFNQCAETTEKLIRSVGALALGKTLDFDEAERSMGRFAEKVNQAMRGNVQYLESIGITLDSESMKAYGAATAIIDAISFKYGEKAAQMMQTSEAMRRSMSASFNEIRKNFADNLLPLMMMFKERIKEAMPVIEQAIMMIVTPLKAIGGVLHGILEIAVNFGNAISNRWGSIEPVIWGIVGAMTAMKVVAIAKSLAFVKAAAGVWKFNAALLKKNVLTGGIVLIIGAVVGAISKWVDSVGGLQIAWRMAVDFILGILANLLDYVVAIIDGMTMPFREFANFIGNVFRSPVGAVIRLFENMGNTVLNIIEPIVNLLNMLPGVRIDFDTIRYGFNALAQSAYSNFAPDFEPRDLVMSLSDKVSGQELVAGIRGRLQGEIDMLRYYAGEYNKQRDMFGMPLYGMGGSGGLSDYAMTTSGGQALRVAQQGPIEIRGEMIRLMEDVVRHRYISGTYRQPVVMNMGGLSFNVNASNGRISDSELARAGEYACKYMVEQFRKSTDSDLQVRGAVLA